MIRSPQTDHCDPAKRVARPLAPRQVIKHWESRDVCLLSRQAHWGQHDSPSSLVPCRFLWRHPPLPVLKSLSALCPLLPTHIPYPSAHRLLCQFCRQPIGCVGTPASHTSAWVSVPAPLPAPTSYLYISGEARMMAPAVRSLPFTP